MSLLARGIRSLAIPLINLYVLGAIGLELAWRLGGDEPWPLALLMLFSQWWLLPAFVLAPATFLAGWRRSALALALELAGKGVTVNTVSPGYIGTDMVKSIRPDVLDKIVAQIPVGRVGEPAEIASIVGWLAGEDSGFTTGAEFSCNGGLHMS